MSGAKRAMLVPRGAVSAQNRAWIPCDVSCAGRGACLRGAPRMPTTPMWIACAVVCVHQHRATARFGCRLPQSPRSRHRRHHSHPALRGPPKSSRRPIGASSWVSSLASSPSFAASSASCTTTASCWAMRRRGCRSTRSCRDLSRTRMRPTRRHAGPRLSLSSRGRHPAAAPSAAR